MNLKEIGEKRQKKWKETDLYKVKEDASKPKFYVLDMFPYPSGAGLHVWHPKWYIASDTLARKKILEGFNVLHPMWFDTFGLWTENYAIEHKMKPQDVAKQNIENYIKQLEMFGTTYDRSRSVNTADPKYFKRTQRVFLQFYNHYYDEQEKKALPIEALEKKLKSWNISTLQHFNISTTPSETELQKLLDQERLAFVDYKPINRCPKCMTGLANEDLDDGKCERCGSEVEQKPMKQRVLRITKYAERLLTWLDTLSREESMKDLERNRIWKSEGTQFDMSVDGMDEKFSVYTTRIDTVFWMSFVAIAPEHPLVEKITTKEFMKDVEKYKDAAKKKSQLERTELQKEKTGVFCGAYAINPFNNEKVPVFVADYVLANYGTWVVMAVPAHDERDFEFAKKYNLPITQTIMPIDQDKEPYPGAEIRHTISAVIQRKSDGKFLFEKWKQFGWISPVIGGIEWEENPLSAAEREVLEETGYRAKAIKTLWRLSESNFFAENKNTWRQRIDQPILMELIDEKANKVNDEEFSRHEPIWLTYEEAIEQTSHKNNLHGLHAFVKWESAFGEYGRLINSWEFTWMTSEEAIPAMQKRLEEKKIWWVKVNYKMQDRVFSRQRYRGEPFPVLRDEKWNIIALDEKELPLALPDVENYEPTWTEEWPLANITDWVNVTLPDWTKAKRETNTMPGRAGSSRYWLRYMDVNNDKALVGKDKEKYRGSVDVYIWGAEHVTRHMIYGRFWQKFLYDIGVVTHEEPFQEYHYVGLIMGEDGRKMSKRRWNVVNPDDIIDQFWADTLRTYEMFMGPFDQAIAWNTAWISGVKKFLDKIIKLSSFVKEVDAEQTEDLKTQVLLNQTIKKVGENIDEFKFNTAVSQLMILTNHLTEVWTLSRQTFETLIILLSPFAPHLAEELWEQLGNEYSIFTKATWPKYDEKYLVADTITMAVQINGKVRGTISLSQEADEQEAMATAKADEKINNWITGAPKKVIYVKGKILNIVV